MPAKTCRSKSNLDLDRSQADAVIRLADAHAAMVAHRLCELECAYTEHLGRPFKFGPLPAEFLIALAALEQIRSWIVEGLEPHLPGKFPPVDDLITLTWLLLQQPRSKEGTEATV